MMRDEMDLGQLTQHLLAAVERTMEPAHVSLWLASPPSERSDAATGDTPHDVPDAPRRP